MYSTPFSKELVPFNGNVLTMDPPVLLIFFPSLLKRKICSPCHRTMFCVLLVSNKQSTITFIGTALLSSKETLSRLAPYVTIFARMSPQQKGEVIASYKSHNYYTLMCGDGTNDVAALKQAHVGMQS